MISREAKLRSAIVNLVSTTLHRRHYVEPHRLTGTMAFMFETRLPQRVTPYAAALPQLQHDYVDCWSGLKKNFDPKKREP